MNNIMQKISVLSLLLLIGIISCNMLRAAEEEDKAIQKIVDKLKSRYPELYKAKGEGLVGESHTGYIESVKDNPSDDTKKLIKEENTDRRALYAKLAEKMGVTIKKIEERNAVRAFEDAEAGEYLKMPNGKWVKKE